MLERNTHHDVFARNICYSPRPGFREEFLIVLLVRSFSCIPDPDFSVEFLVKSFSFNPDASFGQESRLHPSC